MICSKCSAENGEDALYCVNCGERLTDECRKCKRSIPKDVKFCPYCGYPTSGNVCKNCGTLHSDDARFCSACGNSLVEEQKQGDAHHGAEARPQPQAAKPKTPITGKTVARTTRLFVLPVLLLCMFVSSFFGMFRQSTSVLGPSVTVDVTGFDAVRGLFILMDIPSEQEVQEEFSEFCAKEFEGETHVGTDDLEEAIQEFGVVRLALCGDVSVATKMQVVVWALQTLALMILSFVFFVLSLVHAVQVLLGKSSGFYKKECFIYALLAALAFAFVPTSSSLLGGGAFGILILGCIGVAYIGFHNIFVEKAPKPQKTPSVRRGVCALTVVLAAVFLSGALVDVKGYGTETGLKKDYLFESMGGENYDFEDFLEEPDSGNYEKFLKELFAETGLTTRQKEEFLMQFASPSVLCALSDLPGGYALFCKVVSWLMFVFNLGVAALTAWTLCLLLCEDADGKRRKLVPLYAGLTGVVAGVFGTSIAFSEICKAMAEGFKLSLTYSLGSLPILSLIMAVAALTVHLVFACKEKKAQQAAPVGAVEVEQPSANGAVEEQTAQAQDGANGKEEQAAQDSASGQEEQTAQAQDVADGQQEEK